MLPGSFFRLRLSWIPNTATRDEAGLACLSGHVDSYRPRDIHQMSSLRSNERISISAFLVLSFSFLRAFVSLWFNFFAFAPLR